MPETRDPPFQTPPHARPCLSRAVVVGLVVALLWNLLGLVAVLGDVLMTAEHLAALPPDQQALALARPGWSIAGSVLAVSGGVLGCVLLLLRRRLAVPVLVASLAGVVLQDIGLLMAAGGLAGLPPVVLGLQGVVLLVALGLVVLAFRWRHAAPAA